MSGSAVAVLVRGNARTWISDRPSRLGGRPLDAFPETSSARSSKGIETG